MHTSRSTGPMPLFSPSSRIALSRRGFLGSAIAAGSLILPGPLAAQDQPDLGGTLRYDTNDGSQQDWLEAGSWSTVM